MYNRTYFKGEDRKTMKSVGREKIVNTVKIVSAAIIATLIAMLLEVDFFISAGTVSILTIQPTKRETIQTALGRLLAFLIALLIAGLSYGLIGYTLWGFGLFLLLYIFVCQMFGWYSSMAINSVLISHFLTWGSMSPYPLLNECKLFIIGMGIGVLANLHLKKDVDYMEELKEETDSQIRGILYQIADRIMDREVENKGEEYFVALIDSIRKAQNVADANYKNQLTVKDKYDIEFIHMRERQCHVLGEMYKNVHQIHTTPITARKIADFVTDMADKYHKNNTGAELWLEFRELDLSMKGKPLPVERLEFEDRARLFHLLRQMEEFILFKVDFFEKQSKGEQNG